MLRHEFQPGRLVAGAFLTVAGVVCLGDAEGRWATPWFVSIPLVMGGLCLAGAIGTVTRGRRRGRRRSPRGPDPSAGTRSGGAGTVDGTGPAVGLGKRDSHG